MRGGLLTACCGGDAGARHDDDAAGAAGLDVVGHGGQAALGQGQRRGVLGHEGLFLAHFAAGIFVVALVLLGLGVTLLSLDAEVVESVEVVETVVEVGALVGAWPSSVSAAAYLGDAAAVPSVRGTVLVQLMANSTKVRVSERGVKQ